ncbi:restriction system protein [Catalinimonas alkaloidigena]|uniref:Restriction system protein n=2 Tax=Catalinimonas alkaloidigena TaxID=1075417 RepID=A0A1G9AGF1_9BACT|nr:restriction system protein [Catalinimonas alkaloidigena]
MECEYLNTIDSRKEEEVINLIRLFVMPTGNLVADKYVLENLSIQKKNGTDIANEYKYNEYIRRLSSKTQPNWEGLTWIIDLLPNNPTMAINVVEAYYVAHFWFLPDFRINGLLNTLTLIRAKYLDKTHPRDILLNLNPKEFEWLVEYLYINMDYETELTKDSYDGGIDIIAKKHEKGRKETVLVQCKRYTPNIGVGTVRSLLGVVASEKASKGVLVTSSAFSSSAKKMENNNPRIELINWSDLVMLLNKFCGSNWSSNLSRIFLKRHNK